MSKQPNILLITTDQQRYDTIAAMGYDYMYTPNLDRLVREGCSFPNEMCIRDSNQSPAVFMLQERPVICPAPSCENGRKLIYSKVAV